MATMKWINCDERLPKDGTTCLVEFGDGQNARLTYHTESQNDPMKGEFTFDIWGYRNTTTAYIKRWLDTDYPDECL